MPPGGPARCTDGRYYQLSHGCQGDTEKYLTRGNLYHPRHTYNIFRDVVEGNTGVITTLSHRRNHRLLQNFMDTGMKLYWNSVEVKFQMLIAESLDLYFLDYLCFFWI